MQIFKTFKIFKNPSKNCLRRSKKSGKRYSKMLLTKATSYNKFSKYCLALPENSFNSLKHLQKSIGKNKTFAKGKLKKYEIIKVIEAIDSRIKKSTNKTVISQLK